MVLNYKADYLSPMGNMILAGDGVNLTGLWFENQKYCPEVLNTCQNDEKQEIFMKTKEWLDDYFAGRKPDPARLKLKLSGTEFQKKVWNELQKIPYGETVTYGEIAAKLHIKSGQAVGNAVSHNPISIIVPCHRVLGKNGSLTGYAGGIKRKALLLELEQQQSHKGV